MPSGDVRWVAVRSRPERQANGDIIWDGVVLDVSELKRAQETMREAKEEAEKANRAKSEFLSRMSHELRTPLNAILGFGQLLEPRTARARADVQRRADPQGGRHLLDLINEVLDIARIEAGGMEMAARAGGRRGRAGRGRRCSRVRWPSSTASTFVSARARRRRRWRVTADRGRLKQVLLNLFSNAVKYNREGGEVRFACAALPGGATRAPVASPTPGRAWSRTKSRGCSRRSSGSTRRIAASPARASA